MSNTPVISLQKLKSSPSAKQNAIFGALLLIVAIIALAGSISSSKAQERSDSRLREYVSCQTEWTSFLFKALTVRTGASADATKALDNLVNTISTAKSREQVAAALAAYKEARSQQLRITADNPYPEAPKTVCDEIPEQ